MNRNELYDGLLAYIAGQHSEEGDARKEGLWKKIEAARERVRQVVGNAALKRSGRDVDFSPVNHGSLANKLTAARERRIS